MDKYMHVRLPQNLSLTEAINFCSRLWQLEDSEEFVFDFSRLGRVEPFTMALVAAELKRFRSSRPNARFRAENHQNKTYAAHMGFFKAFGLGFGNSPGEAAGSSTYIPLTVMDVEAVRGAADQSYEHVGDVLERESRRLSTVLTRQEEGDLVDTLTFSLREILRNVFEHAESSAVTYCAQYWPSQGKVEVAVLDSGIGVRRSLSANPHLEIDSDRSAVQLALMPGISGKMFRGVRRRPNDVWQNSGFGLYMTSRLCRNGGSFFIASGASGLLLKQGDKRDMATSIPGTALRLVLSTERIVGLRAQLERFKQEGYRLAQRHAGDGAISPSVASTMLSSDFA